MEFKINSNKKVLEENKNNIFPYLGKEDYTTRSVSFTPESELKLNKLRAKYKVSRSAILRILIEQADAHE